MEHSVEPSGSQVMVMDEIKPESQEAGVSRSPNSTSACKRSMASFASSASAFGTYVDFQHYESATDEDEKGLVSKELRKQASFTPGGILPSGSPLRKKRKQPEDEDAAVTDRLKPEETAFLVEEVEKYQDAIEELFVTLNVNDPNYKVPTILELCCEENSGITSAVESRGGRGIRCGLFNGCDLNKKSGFTKAYNLISQERPDVLWVALPCGPSSPIQNLNMLTPEGYEAVQKKVAKSKKLAARALSLMEHQLQLGGEVVQEWPRYNGGWKFKSIVNFWRRLEYYEAYIDGCAYGLCAPAGNGPIKKPWKLRSST